MNYCALIKQGKSIEVKSLPLIPSLDKLLPFSAQFLKIRLLFFVLQLTIEHNLKKPFKLPPESFCSISEQKSRTIHRCLTIEQTKKLCSRCKEYKTTVTGALNAGMVISLKKELTIKNSVNLNTLFAIDLRKFIKSEFAEPHHMGYMTGTAIVTSHLSDSEDFWSLAVKSRHQIEKVLMKGQHLYSPFLAKSRINLFRKAKVLPIILVISNMGITKVPHIYGS